VSTKRICDGGKMKINRCKMPVLKCHFDSRDMDSFGAIVKLTASEPRVLCKACRIASGMARNHCIASSYAVADAGVTAWHGLCLCLKV